MDLIDHIIAYEQGELRDGEIIKFFQDLVDTKQARTLQGSYGRMARRLIKAGLVHPAGEEQIA